MNDEHPVDQHVGDARGRACARGVGGLIGDARPGRTPRGRRRRRFVLAPSCASRAPPLSSTAAGSSVARRIASMSGVPSSRQRRSARAKVPAVRGWVTTSGGSGHSATFGRAFPVHIGGMASLATTASGNVSDRRSSGEIVRVGLVEELGDDHSSRVGRAQLAQARFVGDAFAGSEVGDRVRAPESFVDALGSEERRTDRGGTRPVRVRLGGHAARPPTGTAPTSASTRSM